MSDHVLFIFLVSSYTVELSDYNSFYVLKGDICSGNDMNPCKDIGVYSQNIDGCPQSMGI